MEYKGYVSGAIEFDVDDCTFSATVAGMRDVIHFEAPTTSELGAAFRDSVDAYLAFRGENGQTS